MRILFNNSEMITVSKNLGIIHIIDAVKASLFEECISMGFSVNRNTGAIRFETRSQDGCIFFDFSIEPDALSVEDILGALNDV